MTQFARLPASPPEGRETLFCPLLKGDAVDDARIVLVNTNQIQPPIAPLALDYLGDAVEEAGYSVSVADLNLAEDRQKELDEHLSGPRPLLVGVTFRNSDDCFWPFGECFIPRLQEIISDIRALTDAPVVLGGSGFSVFPAQILSRCDCRFGIRGEGEAALCSLARAVQKGGGFDAIPGLVRPAESGPDPAYHINPPRLQPDLSLGTSRSHVDNRRYFEQGGQLGLETKRGCDRRCTYCADPLVKGGCVRTRGPSEVAEEIENLLRQGCNVLHFCDSEFNIPYDHALAVCRELAHRGLGEEVRWYTYACVTPFADELAEAMKRAGCAGINFGVDSANAGMLKRYGRSYGQEEIEEAVNVCRRHGLTTMLDLMLGGPGETPESVKETIAFVKRIDPDCVGAALGVRLYPGTRLAARVAREEGLTNNPNLHRFGEGAAEIAGADPSNLAEVLLRPVFYVSKELGEAPAEFVREIIDGDERFFAPSPRNASENYNYNQNEPLQEAIRDGQRGAYWDILRKCRAPQS